jgi:hypothetical protein
MAPSSDSRFIFWQRWLLIASLVFFAFGLALSFLNRTPLFELLNRQAEPVFWGSKSVPPEAAVFRSWIYGVAGATIASWGVFLAYVTHYPFKRLERWSWNCAAVGLLVWYVPDTLVSLYFGVLFNVVFSSAFAVIVALPLIFTRKLFYPAEAPR